MHILYGLSDLIPAHSESEHMITSVSLQIVGFRMSMVKPVMFGIPKKGNMSMSMVGNFSTLQHTMYPYEMKCTRFYRACFAIFLKTSEENFHCMHALKQMGMRLL
jgi:hypothetical protein